MLIPSTQVAVRRVEMAGNRAMPDSAHARQALRADSTTMRTSVTYLLALHLCACGGGSDQGDWVPERSRPHSPA